MSEWRWLVIQTIIASHDRQLSEHKGGEGTRDLALLVSALAKPLNLAAYGSPDAASLAASYAFGIARNHPFVDGNKRTAWIAARLFLSLNGVSIEFDKIEATNMVLELAAGKLTEDEVAAWFRARIVS